MPHGVWQLILLLAAVVKVEISPELILSLSSWPLQKSVFNYPLHLWIHRLLTADVSALSLMSGNQQVFGKFDSSLSWDHPRVTNSTGSILRGTAVKQIASLIYSESYLRTGALHIMHLITVDVFRVETFANCTPTSYLWASLLVITKILILWFLFPCFYWKLLTQKHNSHLSGVRAWYLLEARRHEHGPGVQTPAALTFWSIEVPVSCSIHSNRKENFKTKAVFKFFRRNIG